MFLSNFQERDSSEVDFMGFDQPSVFDSIINYMYTGEIQITTGNAQALFQSADHLQLFQLKAKCKEFLSKHIEPYNCIGIHRLAVLYSQEDLEARSHVVMLKQFQDMISTPEFLEMSESELVEYLSDCRLEVQNEDMVFEAVLAWVHAGPQERMDSFPSIAPCIQFRLFSADFLNKVIRQEPLMADASC